MFLKVSTVCSLFILLLMISCDDDDTICLDLFCGPTPTEGELSIIVTINQENPWVPVTIFDGDFEAGNVLFYDTLTMKSRTYPIEFGDYSVTVEYNKGSITILAVDGGSVYVVQDPDPSSCDDCPSLHNLKLNLELAD